MSDRPHNLFPHTLQAWPDDVCRTAIKRDLENLGGDVLPLHRATTQGGMVDDSRLSVTVLSAEAVDGQIQVRAGVFFSEVVGGCNCHDDPVEANGYCLLAIRIDPHTGTAGFTLLPD